MALTQAQMDAKLDEHFAFEAADDVGGVLATLAEDVEHDIVGWPAGPARSHADVRAFYESLFADLADGQVTSTRRLYGKDFMVDDSIWRGTAPGRPFGIEGKGRPLEFRLLHVLEFDAGGAIGRESVWIDLAAIQRQLG
jgi:predicted ester cyclase